MSSPVTQSSAGAGPAARPTIVCVIGSPRAGTSLTMRVLNLLGVYVGPETALKAASPGNPKGFWENEDMMRLNHRLLRALGGSWRDPPSPPEGWEQSDRLSAERQQAEALLRQTFGDRALWGWKDASLSLTLPFWQGLAPDMRYVICTRNPIEVAFSGNRLRDIPIEEAVSLWVPYIARALVDTAVAPRVLVSYEDWHGEWRQTVDRLARFIGVEAPPIGGEVDRSIERFFDRDLRNHRIPNAGAVSDDRLPVQAASLYLALELLHATAPVCEPGTADAELHAAVDRYARRLLG